MIRRVSILAALMAVGVSSCGANIKGDFCVSTVAMEAIYSFDGRSKVEVTAASFGMQNTEQASYEVKDGKVYIGDEGSKQVIDIKDNDTLDAGMFELSRCE